MKLPNKQWTGKDVERLLKKHNLTQHDLQRLTHIMQPRFSDWIHGKHQISNITCYALDRIEQLLEERKRQQKASEQSS